MQKELIIILPIHLNLQKNKIGRISKQLLQVMS